MSEFVTYIYYDPSRGNEPFYVGKGRADRPWRHKPVGQRPMACRLRELRAKGIKPVIGVYGGLSEQQAARLEIALIARFGRVRKGTGTLVNFTAGGGRLEAAHSPESKAKISRTRSEQCRLYGPWGGGKTWYQATAQARSE